MCGGPSSQTHTFPSLPPPPQVRASFLQIYNEVISDLLKPEATNLVVREDKRRGVHVEGLR